MLSRIAFLRVVGVIAVLTVGGVAAAKMGHRPASAAGDVQLADATTSPDAAQAPADVAISGRAMFPIAVGRDVASQHSDVHATAQVASVDRLRDLDQLRGGAPAAIVFGSRGYSRNGGSSSAFGGHGFAGGGSFGSVGMGGGRAPQSDTKKAAAPAVAAKAPASSTPAPPRTPSSAPPVATPAPAIIPPTVTPPSLAGPVVAPPIFASQITPIPAIAGGTANTDPAPLGGAAGGGGAIASKGPSLSPTPEPASLLLIATGLAAVIGVSRRRQPRP